MKICPKDEKIIPNGKRCKKCEHYISKQWFSRGKKVDMFCGYNLSSIAKKYLK